jgi:hypothetical protein
MIFGNRTPGETVLLLDVEQGSVGAALARFSPGEKPRLFGQVRRRTPLLPSHDGGALARHALAAAREALQHASTTAARLRQSSAAPLGDVSRAALFLSAPWGAPDLAAGAPRVAGHFRDELLREVDAFFGALRTSTHTGADAAAFAARLRGSEPVLLIMPRSELIEMLSLGTQGVTGYGSAPLGFNSTLRTLRSHAGLSAEEALSRLSLPHEVHADFEPLAAAREHLLSYVRQLAPTLMREPALRVLVVSERPHAGWFAKALAQDEKFGSLFEEGSAVEALGPHHLAPFAAPHAPEQDIFLLTEAVFMDQKINRV